MLISSNKSWLVALAATLLMMAGIACSSASRCASSECRELVALAEQNPSLVCGFTPEAAADWSGLAWFGVPEQDVEVIEDVFSAAHQQCDGANGVSAPTRSQGFLSDAWAFLNNQGTYNVAGVRFSMPTWGIIVLMLGAGWAIHRTVNCGYYLSKRRMDKCPICGGEKWKKDPICLPCWQQRATNVDACPICGEEKWKKDPVCLPCWERWQINKDVCPNCGGEKWKKDPICFPCWQRQQTTPSQ